MNNRLARKALDLLCSPPSLLAMAVLALNDHLLRVRWPSWATGKLGDLAWLFFFPFAMAWGWALIFPRREGLVRALAFGLTGGLFTLAKTSAAGHAAVVGAVGMLLGRPVGWVRDPTDLMALVSLAAGWVMWGRVAEGGTGWKPVLQGRRRRALRAGGALAAVLLLTAQTPRSDGGVRHLELWDEGIVSTNFDGVYLSRDGGLVWEELKVRCRQEGSAYKEAGKGWVAAPELWPWCSTDLGPADKSPTMQILEMAATLHFRYAPGEPIEVSEDGGATWRVIVDGSTHVLPYTTPGPWDALLDPQTGNVIFAMGVEGVLVRAPDGQIWLASVGDANWDQRSMP